MARWRTHLVFGGGVLIGVMLAMVLLPRTATHAATPSSSRLRMQPSMPAPNGPHAYDSEVHSASPGGAGTPSVNPPRGGDGDATDPAAECMPCPDVPSAPDCLCEPDEEDGAVVQDGGTGGVGTGPRDDDDEAVEPEPAPAPPQAAAVGVEALLRPASVAGKDPSKTELSCDDLLAIRRSPYTPQAGPQPLFIEWYYRCVYEPMVIKKTIAPKAIVWKRPPKETAGFGNQLRGEYGALVLAMVTQRLFLIDDQMMDFYFHSPPAVDWRFNTHKGLFKKPKTLAMAKPMLEEFKTMDPDMWKAEYDLWQCPYVWSVDAELGDNPLVQQMYERVLFASLSGFKRIGLVFEWMLQRPSAPLRQAVSKARRRMGFANDRFMGVQYRTFKHGKYFDKFVKDAEDGKVTACVAHMVEEWAGTQAQGKAAIPKHVFFTTDRDRVFTHERMKKDLGQWGGTVHMNKGSYEPSGKLGARAWRSVSQALVDWYLLGEASPSIIGGTSYGVSAAARVGFRNGLYVIAGHLCEGDYHSPPRLRPDPWRDLTI